MRRSNEETVNEVLKLENENYKLNEIAEKMESNPTTIRRAMNRSGYKTKNGIFIKEDDKSITNVINDSNNTDNKDNTSVIQEDTEKAERLQVDILSPEAAAIISNDDIKNNLLKIVNQYDKIQNIIDWFDSRDDKDNTSVIQLDTVLKIDLPKADIKRTTIRVNEKIWNNFNNLADKYKEYDKHSLLSMALKEFIERYQ